MVGKLQLKNSAASTQRPSIKRLVQISVLTLSLVIFPGGNEARALIVQPPDDNAAELRRWPIIKLQDFGASNLPFDKNATVYVGELSSVNVRVTCVSFFPISIQYRSERRDGVPPYAQELENLKFKLKYSDITKGSTYKFSTSFYTDRAAYDQWWRCQSARFPDIGTNSHGFNMLDSVGSLLPSLHEQNREVTGPANSEANVTECTHAFIQEGTGAKGPPICQLLEERRSEREQKGNIHIARCFPLSRCYAIIKRPPILQNQYPQNCWGSHTKKSRRCQRCPTKENQGWSNPISPICSSNSIEAGNITFQEEDAEESTVNYDLEDKGAEEGHEDYDDGGWLNNTDDVRIATEADNEEEEEESEEKGGHREKRWVDNTDGNTTAGFHEGLESLIILILDRGSVPNIENTTKSHVISWAEIASRGASRAIWMEPFPEVHLFGATVKVTCLSYSFYTASNFQLALQLQDASFVFLAANNSLRYWITREYGETNDDENLLYSRTMVVHLNRTDASRIFCFSPIQNTYEWINASRPVKALDAAATYDHFTCSNDSASMFFTPPKIKLKQESRIFNLSSDTFDLQCCSNPGKQEVKARVSGKRRDWFFVLTCEAPYPIELLQTLPFYPTPIYTGDEEAQEYSRVFSQLSNSSTDIFKVYKSFSLADEKTGKQNHVFRCQSVQQPCVYQSLHYIYRAQNDHRNGFTDATFSFYNSCQNNTSLEKVDKENQNPEVEVSWNFAPDAKNGSQCEVTFYYQKLPTQTFPGYAFHCSSFGSKWMNGDVKFHGCGYDISSCMGMFKGRRQPRECWEEVPGDEIFGSEFNPANLEPGFLQCTFGGTVEDDEEYNEESFMVSFVFFGVSLAGKDERQKIYFSLEDPEFSPSKLIVMKPFDKYQYLGNQLEVVCISSWFYFAPEPFIVLEFESESRGISGNLTAIAGEREIWDDFLFARVYNNTIHLTTTSLRRIFCMAGSMISDQWVNASQPIFVATPQSPTVTVMVETPNGENWENSIDHIQPNEYEAELHSINETIICDAFGYPAPDIFWTSTSSSPFQQSEPISMNLTWTRRTVVIVEVSGQSEGNYTCAAKNEQGHDIKTLAIRVRDKRAEFRRSLTVGGSILGPLLLIAFCTAIGTLILRVRKERERTSIEKAKLEKFLNGDPLLLNSSELNTHIRSLPYDLSFEIPWDSVEITSEILGSGNFGEVRKGIFRRTGSSSGQDEKSHVESGLGSASTYEMSEYLDIAVKTVKANPSFDDLFAFVEEVKIMAYLNHHENVIRLIGASTVGFEKKQVFAALEYCARGDLLKLLKSVASKRTFQNLFEESSAEIDSVSSSISDETEINQEGRPYDDETFFLPEAELNTVHLIKFCIGASHGMAYLTEKNVIHGDLAARNILLTEQLQVKLADFGLARQLMMDQTSYIKNPQKREIPWKWLSIEAFRDRQFSIKSDVWSFGVVCWEMFTLGKFPYDDYLGGDNFLTDLIQGMRLAKPDYANDYIYQLMMNCWLEDRDVRPPFAVLHDKFCQLLSPDANALNDLNS